MSLIPIPMPIDFFPKPQIYLMIHPDGQESWVAALPDKLKLMKANSPNLWYDPRIAQVKGKVAHRLSGPNADLVCYWLAWSGPEHDINARNHHQGILVGYEDTTTFVGIDASQAAQAFQELVNACGTAEEEEGYQSSFVVADEIDWQGMEFDRVVDLREVNSD